MKYMRWGWQQLVECPHSLLPVIADMAKREAAAIERSKQRRR